MALFGNYNTPGRGVLKTPHEKRPFFKFWEIYFRHCWQLMGLNMFYFLFTIPLFATVILASENLKWLALMAVSGIMGPATAAMTRVVRNFSQERPTFMMHDFFRAFKRATSTRWLSSVLSSVCRCTSKWRRTTPRCTYLTSSHWRVCWYF